MKKRIARARAVALVVNPQKREARAAATEIAALLRERGIRVVADPETAALLGDSSAGRDARLLAAEACLAVSVGGDGTVLKAARIIAGSGVPLLGVNLGGLGFLTACTRAEMRDCLLAALAGRCRAEERMMLRVSVRRKGREMCRHVVLNDAVVSKGTLSRLVTLETFIGREYLVTFVADGLIVASPTGSTAYSLSAGGPLVSPDMDAIILAPICPHMLTNRPLVVPGERKVRVRVAGRGRDAVLTLDGQVGESLRDGDEVVVGEAREKLRLAVSPRKEHYQLLREKLHWGGRLLHA